ncbi:MAG: MBL fold metallo-hydrolase [Deltaproteobacteria bacterium]|nr:MBL fold metallo-hydrolase [Deltaproteobacteria bacterium]
MFTTMIKPHKDRNHRFYNSWAQKRKWVSIDLVKWLVFSRNRFREEKKRPVSFPVDAVDFGLLSKDSRDYIVWLGHSTVLMRVGGRTVITDPVFWDVNFLVRRKTRFPVDPDALPHIDYVLISHGHYDHLNTKSVRFLKERFDPVFVSGPGYEDYFRSAGVSRCAPIGWWEALSGSGVRITSLPVQHWSRRTIFDANKMLWCGFLIENLLSKKKYCWLGDSGYFGGFKDIGERFGPIDFLLVPVGAYEPRWFMKPNHMNPEEALTAAQDMRAKTVIPIHWGTFDLTDEPLYLPIERLKEVYDGKSGIELKILNHGGHIVVE